MSGGVGASRYSLEAVRQREGWTLDALQMRLAVATVEQATQRARHAELQGGLQLSVADGFPTHGSVIDPATFQRRLRDLADRQRASAASARALASLAGSIELLRQSVKEQHARLESVERHRAQFLRSAVAEEGRKRCADADRAWLAQAVWRRHTSAAPSPAGDPRPDRHHGDGS